MMQTVDPYVDWLRKKGARMFESRGAWWTPYEGGLVPASMNPVPLELEPGEAECLLRESRCHLVRYFSRNLEEPSDFWYVQCADYDFERLSGKMRTKIRRAYKDCSIRELDPVWLSTHGQECYYAAFARYRDGRPDSREIFMNRCCLRCVGGPFQFWGAFVGDTLAGFAKCIVGNDYVTMVVFKIHPDHFRSRPAYALIDTILRTYITVGKPINNGFKPISHATNMQDFLLQFGFRRVYCDLQIVYRPTVRLLVDALYPLKRFVAQIPDSRITSAVRGLLAQEQIRRSFTGSLDETQG